MKSDKITHFVSKFCKYFFLNMSNNYVVSTHDFDTPNLPFIMYPLFAQ